MSDDMFREFMSAKTKAEDAQRALQESRQALFTKQRTKRRDELCLEEFEKMPEQVQYFRGIGKCYVMTPKEKVFHDLESNIETLEKEVTTLEGKCKYMESQARSSTARFNELVSVFTKMQAQQHQRMQQQGK